MDVFFRGHGKWRKTQNSELALPNNEFGVYFAGVFKASEYDERIYTHTDNLECCGALFPSPEHPDDAFTRFPEFLRQCLAFGDADLFATLKPGDVYFEVDVSQPYEFFLAKPISSIAGNQL